MEYSDTLLTITEIAVAIAGFGSLVTVLGRSTGDGESRIRSMFRLRLVLENSLRIAGMALLPLPFLQVAAHDPAMWRTASGLLLTTNIAWVLASIRRYRASGLAPERNSLVYSIFAVALITTVVDVANIVGLGGTHAFSLYLASVLLSLGSTGLLFLLVVISVFGPEPE